MSEFKFSCPACRQNILCDVAMVGKEINCPQCKALIIVPPQAFANPTPTLPPGTPGGAPAPKPIAPPAVMPVQKTSGLAIASLICSLTSLVTCVGWIPGIICGHIAKSGIRKNPALKGSGLATAGLVIGYLILTVEIGSVGVYGWKFSRAMKQGFNDFQSGNFTNDVVTVQTQTNPPDDTQPELAPDNIATNNVIIVNATADANWMNDPDKMSAPDHAVSGKIHGNDFQLRRAVIVPAGLRLVSANRLIVEVHGLGTAVEGKNFEVRPAEAANQIPHVQILWSEGVLEPTAAITHGYAMKLEFGQASNGTLPGKIYLCLPDNSKSWVAGTFEVKSAR